MRGRSRPRRRIRHRGAAPPRAAATRRQPYERGRLLDCTPLQRSRAVMLPAIALTATSMGRGPEKPLPRGLLDPYFQNDGSAKIEAASRCVAQKPMAPATALERHMDLPIARTVR